MKRTSILVLLWSCMLANLIAQDGSNINYYEVQELDSTFLGKLVHIDFGKTSFAARAIDTLEITIKGQRMKFYEHREDDGHNNWFHKQYLIRAKDKHPFSARLQNSSIDSISSDKVYVTSSLRYYIEKAPIDSITVFSHWYPKSSIAKVLIKE